MFSGQKFDVWLDRVKSIIEILAIISAGVWVAARFPFEQRPAWTPRFETTSSLDWFDVSDEQCIASYSLQFKNVGSTTIDASGIIVEIWISDKWSFDGDLEYINPTRFETGTHTTHTVDQTFANSYPPGTSERATLDFAVRKIPDKAFLIRATFPKVRGGYGEGMSHYDYRWDVLCGGPELHAVRALE